MPDGSLDGFHPDEELPSGGWTDGRTLARDVDEVFDAVVIGSGAAGAVAAYRLADAGLKVAIVEEGPWIKTRDLGGDVIDGFRTLFRDAGLQAIEGRAFMPLLQGRCVGGSTVINSAISWRIPEDVLHDWSSRFGVPLAMEMLEPHYAALEHELSVRAVGDDALGENNRRFLDQAERAGIDAQAMRRYERGCVGSGRCLTGCPHGAKQAMNVTYVPRALWKGAHLFSSVTAERVVFEGTRASMVEGHVIASDGSRRRVRLRARKAIVVAASTVQSPQLLRRSGVRSAHLGEHFQVHPGLAVLGVFDDPVDMSFGATQGADSIHYRKSGRFKLETISMPPELVIARMPGAGVELAQRMLDYPHVGMWCVQIRAEAEGRVGRTLFGRERVTYSLTPRDLEIARRACGVLARLFFEAGAREVWPGVYGVPSIMHSIDQVAAIDDGPIDARAYSFIATHLFGAARMGPDPSASVVGLDFGVHGTKGLYVVDSSVFPTNLGVNPQHTIMALSRLASERIAEAA
jgi:choline dehydrogenase-like flavoprotein